MIFCSLRQIAFVFFSERLASPNEHSDFELRGVRIGSVFPRVSNKRAKRDKQNDRVFFFFSKQIIFKKILRLKVKHFERIRA